MEVIPTALGNVDVYVCGLGVGGGAGVVPGVRRRGRADRERRLGLGTRLRDHGHSSRLIVVDHASVVIPEYVLRRHWTLYKVTELIG